LDTTGQSSGETYARALSFVEGLKIG